MWGKRDAKDWQKLQAGWGKRNSNFNLNNNQNNQNNQNLNNNNSN